MFLSEIGGCFPLEMLSFTLSFEDGDELWRQRDGLAAPLLDFAEDEAATNAIGADGRVPVAAWRADLRIVGRDADMRAGLAESFGTASRAGLRCLPAVQAAT